MLDLLLPELQELIFKRIKFELGRSINKHFKALADKLELNRKRPILVSKKCAMTYLDTIPIEFSYLSVITGSDLSPLEFRFVEIENRLYLSCLNIKCKLGKCDCSHDRRARLRGLTSIEERKHYLEKLDFGYFQSGTKHVFLPGYKFIEHSVMQHPLSKTDPKFLVKIITISIDYYMHIIRSIIDKNIRNNRVLEIFFKNIRRELNIAEEYKVSTKTGLCSDLDAITAKIEKIYSFD
jgi:hypothetical protein